MVVTARRLRCGALLSCCLLIVRTLASEQPASYYDIRPSDGLNETGPWDVFFNDTTLVFSYDPVAANATDSGQDEPLSSPSWEERYDLLPLQNDSSPLLEYREPFQPLPSLTDEERKTVYLLGLFELTGSCEAAKGGRAERAAARLAIRHVNERNVVPGHRLEMYDNDTRAYGQPVVQQIRCFVSLSTQVAAFQGHLKFNSKCKALGLIPRSLRLGKPVMTPFGLSVVDKAERQLLQARIQDCREKVGSIENQAFFARRHLECHLPNEFQST
ncbi:hypothetical protein HPB51_012946 [Rhipicephalus microplus]|uniref:Uncharacterized protein n=1 Tax=Rhipicephalus microplus TaxID=6941 RepID=A0A9J6F3V7_RHIMP|nr:hypothetical protein HPB51_012946 [Rhipicephalus microplus]